MTRSVKRVRTRYAVWPRPPLTVALTGHRRTFGVWVTSAVVYTTVLSLPPVRAATGVSLGWVLSLVGAHLAWTAVVVYVLQTENEFRSRRALDVAMAGNLLLNTAIAVAFCAIGGDPKTPLWMLPVAYAMMNAAHAELGPSWVILAVHVLGPLATIPMFLAGGDENGWGVAAPVVCAGFSAAMYHALAMGKAKTFAVIREHEEELATLRAELERRDRARLAQDLHDSVGSALGLVALYGDLIERSCDDPEKLRSIASVVRDATKEGLSDLRAVLGAIAPASTDIAGLARALGPIARRVSAATCAEVELSVSGAGDVEIGGPARLAIVRIFQEALHNAVKHARASNVAVVLEAQGEHLVLDVIDDGVGIASAPPEHDGRGLRGMRERVAELGGSFVLDAGDGVGTRLRVTVPRMRAS